MSFFLRTWIPHRFFSSYRVLLCLKRALRIANAAQQMASVTRGTSGPVTLFVEILNKSVFCFELEYNRTFHNWLRAYWYTILLWYINVITTKIHQVRLLFWERQSSDHICRDPGAGRINHHRDAKRVRDRDFRPFLFGDITVHPVSKAERRGNGWEICFNQGLTACFTWEDL